MGCGASTRSDGPGIVAETAALDRKLPQQTPSAETLRDCAGPVDIPDRDLSEGETERLWRDDRISLVDCGQRKRAVQKFYSDRDARIGAQP